MAGATMSCQNARLWAKRCSKAERWIVRINDDPDTDLPMCTVHADLTVRRCHPVPVSKTLIEHSTLRATTTGTTSWE